METMDQSSDFSSEEETTNGDDSSNKSEFLIGIEPSVDDREKELHSLCQCIDLNCVNFRNESQDANLSPLVWQKFQYLLSVLKDIQNNIQQMDSLILDQKEEKHSSTSSLSDRLSEKTSPMNHLVNTVESSKTDEAKLNEILGLLHCITRTLSSFEQNPLLADELKEFGKKVSLNSTIITSGEDVHEGVGDGTCENFNRDGCKSYPVHHFTKETTTLRGEIEDAIRRKKVLDERLNSLIVHRQTCQGELVENKEIKESTSLTSESLQMPQQNEAPKVDLARSLSSHSTSCSSKHSVLDEAVIMDLRNDENEIPGLAESGLSSEINSLGITMNNILEENKQLYAICNDFAEPEIIGEDTEKGIKEPNGAKPKEKKHKRKSGKNFSFGGQDFQSNFPFIENQNLETSFSLSVPFLKKTFDKKLKELMKEQTDIISELNGEKKLFSEKTRSLEKVVADLMKINRENRRKYVEEIQVVDVENCRLEDELFSVKRENQKLIKECQRLKSLENISSESHNNGKDKMTLNNCSHCSCYNKCHEYFQLLLKDKELNETSMSKELKKCSNLRQKLMNEMPTCHLSSSEGNLNNQEGLPEDHKFSSLPIIVTPAETVSMKDNRDTIEASNSEMNLLRERIDCLEEHVNQRVTTERLNRSSNAIPSSDVDLNPAVPFHSPISSTLADSHEYETLKYKEKITSLFKENEELVKRVEELMGMIRELSSLVRSTKEELLLTRKERNLLLEKFKKRVESDDFDQVITSSEGFIKVLELNQKLQEKCSHLQLELEKTWNEAQKNASERDKMVIEKEALNQFVTSSLADIEEENSALKIALKNLEEQTLKSSLTRSELLLTDKQTQTEESFFKDEDKDVLEVSKDDKANQCSVEQNNIKSRDNEINERWQSSLLWLQRCFAEEKLHNQVLEAAERENSARVAVLQQRVKERGEKYQELLAKYKKLHLMLLASKVEKKANKRVFKECTSKIEEYNSTTAAIEDNYKIMLSSLGNNIGIAVEILSSHLYFSPSHVHPSPELSADPAFWFAAQCSRLRWLQTQLRKLCLHSWKNSDFIAIDIKGIKNSREKFVEKGLVKGRSFEFEGSADNLNSNILKTSYSTPTSPSRVMITAEKNESDMVCQDPINFSPSSGGVSNILSSLNDAELNLTSQQVKLARSKNLQFSNIVGILKRNGGNGNSVSVASSMTSDVVSFRNSDPFVDENFESVETTLSENEQITPKLN